MNKGKTKRECRRKENRRKVKDDTVRIAKRTEGTGEEVMERPQNKNQGREGRDRAGDKTRERTKEKGSKKSIIPVSLHIYCKGHGKDRKI